MAVDVDIEADGALIRALENLAPGKVMQAVRRASKRAGTAARTAGTKKIREIYTIRSSDLKARTRIESADDGTVIRVRGPVESVKRYRARRNRRGIFVRVKKSGGGVVARSFDLHGQFVARESKARLPIHGLHGPSVPSLFGNPDVLDTVEKRGGEMFEQRLEHEISHLLEGGK